MFTRSLVIASVTVAASLAAAPALADEPAPAKAAAAPQAPATPAATPPTKESTEGTEPKPRPWSAGAQIGAGSDNLGLGIGARLGYTLPMNLYLGGSLTYFATTASYSSGSVYILAPGAELGYDAKIGPVVLRPYGGLGVAIARASVPLAGTTVTATDSRAALWGGLQATYDITQSFYVGGDVRLLTTVNGRGSAIAGFASLGAKF